jgi:DNA-binding NtrC family response regulator
VDPSQESAPASRRLLHINHPAAILRLVERFCQSKKFSLDSFESTAIGLHHAMARKYHIIILGLPTKGLDSSRFLKGLLRARISTPVLLMAESRSKEKLELGKFPNVIGTISKPLDIHEFSKYLDSANKPPELDSQEKEKLIAVLRKWEGKIPHAR